VTEAAAGPVQVRATVLTLRRVDAYHALTLVAPAIATRFRPGQFVTVAVGGPETSLLGRRAFVVHDVYGSAPLFALAAKLTDRGSSVDFLLGGQSADRVFGALTARRSGRSATITTADGSLGARGPVTVMLEQVIREARTEVIYASAPVPVLRDVTALAARYSIPVQASVDVAMACGIGVCMGCVLPVTGTDGITRIVRACVDGPVFRADLVRWDDVGTIPFDALGAPGWKPKAEGHLHAG